MAAAETRTPDATKPLAGREASMDGKPAAGAGRYLTAATTAWKKGASTR
jgi:hypothetical protein